MSDGGPYCPTCGEVARIGAHAYWCPDEPDRAVGARRELHEFDPGYTGMSETCNALVDREGHGDTCGLSRERHRADA